MRIVDQSGCVDIPYEQTVLVIDEGSIVARIPDGGQILMAQYSSIEVAKKAIEKMWRAYQKSESPTLNDIFSNSDAVNFFQFPKEEHMR